MSSTTYRYDDDGRISAIVHIQQPMVTVDTYYQLNKKIYHGRGNAKCDESDPFNVEIGVAIAGARANERLSKRLLKAAKRITDDPYRLF